MKIGIVGGGAAGFFAAITVAEKAPDAEITILEKSSKVLSKVKVSGGGRCNVTNATFENYQLAKNYPRGSKELRKAFDIFSVKDTIRWFEQRGVRLKTEEDKRMFPSTDSSQTIIDCFLREAEKLKIRVLLNHGVQKMMPPSMEQNLFTLTMTNGETLRFNKILIATGGHPSEESYRWLSAIQPIVPPVPSLFTFNLSDHPFKDLPGIAVAKAQAKIAGSKETQEGPVLITHWGLSGPAILRLSAWEARKLHEQKYTFTALINWIPPYEESSLRDELSKIRAESPKKTVRSNPMFLLPKRLWERFTELAAIPADTRWADISQKSLNRLLENLIRNPVHVKGKTTFKEEFVTCGGIDLKNINFETMESRLQPGLYFAGEILDIDGITGGFNFQAAWTTGYIAGNSIAKGKAEKPY